MVRKTVSGAAKANKSASAAKRGDARQTLRKVSATSKDSASTSHRAGAPPAVAPQTASKGMLRAGLKALSDVRNDVVARQSRMFESLLGLGQPGVAKAAAVLPDPFGFRKFEDVFDERVARALERLGMPSAAAIQALSDRVDALEESVERLTGAKAPRAKSSAGKNRHASALSSKSARGPRQDP